MKKYYVLLAIVVVLCVAIIGILYLQHRKPSYRIYKSNIEFSYPSSWDVVDCQNMGSFFLRLPGTYKASDGRKTEISAYGGSECKGSKVLFRVSSQKTDGQSCGISKEGERLHNGLYIQLSGEPHSQPSSIWITQNPCYVDTPLISFRLHDTKTDTNFLKFDREKMLKSHEYTDIKKLAESIRILSQSN